MIKMGEGMDVTSFECEDNEIIYTLVYREPALANVRTEYVTPYQSKRKSKGKRKARLYKNGY